MGIKGLFKIIKTCAPSAIEEVTMESLRGKTIAIDVPIFMYKFAYLNPDDPLEGFRYQLATVRRFDIHPIYVFDGVAHVAKAPELEKRKERKRKAKDDLVEASDRLKATKQMGDVVLNFGAMADAMTQFQKAHHRVVSVPSKDQYRLLQEYFAKEGVDWIQATHDAEKTAAGLVSSGKAYAVASNDTDTLPYLCGGGREGRLVTEFGKETMKMYDLAKVLAGLGLGPKPFVDFCILSGSDLCSKIRNVAGKRALSFVQSHGSIENILRTLDQRKYVVPEDFPYQRARDEFGV